jgi:hypothetical protein
MKVQSTFTGSAVVAVDAGEASRGTARTGHGSQILEETIGTIGSTVLTADLAEEGIYAF